MELVVSLTLVGAFQGFLLGAILLSKTKLLGQSSIWLLLLCFSVGLTLLDASFYLSDVYQKIPNLIGVGFPLSLVFCPLILGYIHHILRKSYSKKFLWHFAPAAISIFLLIPFFLLDPEEKSFFLYQGIKEELIDSFFPVIGFAFVIIVSFVQGIIYVYWSLKSIRQHRLELEGFYSSDNDVSLKWLTFVVWFMAAIWILSLLQVFIGSAFQISDEIYIVNHSLLVLAMYLLSYFSYEKRDIFQQLLHYRIQDNEDGSIELNGDITPERFNEQSTSKYSNSSIDEHLSKMIFENAKDFLTSSEVFLDSELSLSMLAELLEVSPHHLSQAINQNFNRNFFEFINYYRVNTAKKYLEDKSGLKVLDIAYACGFNSKSAFYTAFKKCVNSTPGEYRKSLVN